MKAVILAGGRGTRLAEYTKEIPKPMLQVGGTSILEHQINLLLKYGVNEIYILVNYLKDIIINHFGDGSTYGVKINYYEEPKPLGTVGGLTEIEAKLENDFLLFHGDIMINMDLSKLISFHHDKKSKCTLVVHPNAHPSDSDLVDIDDSGRIEKYYPIPHVDINSYRNISNSGIYILSKEIFKFLQKGEKADFGQDILPNIVDKIPLFGYVTSEYIKDMSTPERWREVNEDFKNGKVFQFNLENKQKAIFFDRDGVINVEKKFIKNSNDLEFYYNSTDAIRIVNQSEYLSIVVTNQSGIARNLYTIDDLDNVHKKMEAILGRNNTYIDAIYFCPHYNEECKVGIEKLLIDCECRKPKPGLFFNAAKDYNLDLSECWMIGDSERDIIAGNKAGCSTVGVKTGYGLTDTTVMPDFFFSDIHESTEFIIKTPYLKYFSEINQRVKVLDKRPIIILVDGIARSGKSNFASYLCRQFKKNFYEVLVIKLENWLLTKQQNVIYKKPDKIIETKITEDFKVFFKGEKIECIDKNSLNQNERETQYEFKNQEIIIVEGNFSFDVEYLLKLADIKAFTICNEDTQTKRLIEHCKWKNYSENEIQQVLNENNNIYYSQTDKGCRYADIIIGI